MSLSVATSAAVANVVKAVIGVSVTVASVYVVYTVATPTSDKPITSSAEAPAEGKRRVHVVNLAGDPIKNVLIFNVDEPKQIACSRTETNWVDLPEAWVNIRVRILRPELSEVSDVAHAFSLQRGLSEQTIRIPGAPLSP